MEIGDWYTAFVGRFGKIGAVFFIILLLTGFAGWQWAFADLPPIDEIESNLFIPTIRIVDRHGEALYDVIDPDGGRNTALPPDQIPDAIKNALIATEDASFYQNQGIALRGIIRALWINLRGGEIVSGGSTITQQVARNLLLADEKYDQTVKRKLRESLLAYRITQNQTKDEILALYLNQSYFGGQAYGIEAASLTYFGKPASDTTTAEAALLIGLLQSPNSYNPLTNPDQAKARQEIVLNLMADNGFLETAGLELATRQPLAYTATPYTLRAPHFTEMVRRETDEILATLPEDTLLTSGGITVRTTLDLNHQTRAEALLENQLDQLSGNNAHNAAIVTMDVTTGEILTLVGNRADSEGSDINMAVSPRQPGSTLKPFVYAQAMQPPTNWTAATQLNDVRTAFLTADGEPYVPVNYGRTHNGPVLVRDALASSLNIPAVIALETVGLDTMLNTFSAYGLDFGDPDDFDLAVALGGRDTTLLDLTTAYATLANNGARPTPTLILDLTTADGNTLYTPPARSQPAVLDEQTAWLISHILSDDSAREMGFGRNSILNIGKTAAVKTGTSNDARDNWTMGYTREVAVGVWVGNADREPMVNVTGVTGAGPLWHGVIRAVTGADVDQPFIQPDGFRQVEICALSGLLPTQVCPNKRFEWFVEGSEPAETDSFYREIDGELVLDLPPTLHEWARGEGWTVAADLAQPAVSAPITITYPDPNTVFRISAQLTRESQQIALKAVVDQAVSKVEFYIDNQLLQTDESVPFEVWWKLQPGRHQVYAIGFAVDEKEIISEPVVFEVNSAESP